MRWTLALLILLGLGISGCEMTLRDDGGKHSDGPGNSENAPGHNKH